MFFPNNNNNTFFIKEDELDSYTFKGVIKKRGNNIELIGKLLN
jgi:hypothetical protein